MPSIAATQLSSAGAASCGCGWLLSSCASELTCSEGDDVPSIAATQLSSAGAVSCGCSWLLSSCASEFACSEGGDVPSLAATQLFQQVQPLVAVVGYCRRVPLNCLFRR